ncbi:glycoside hydrolase family 3 protein [Kibdelosporangium phytohabitans]|uniref:beta-glucosidase n=1 Tax=Kibdelosporangium phytohabitans TaxID=860235 RepID=A0A0N9HUM1_9PSEU|nr:glycoside hydrolase family 3 N-terminal domain-containing protein [Kibdelosporangium phytohabitans]ALG07237.1 beta-glucosidase [Kibdelosporangium phytohabitans]MBE1471908.1 beta-glucosidase [Kibdelosporangium phytohabitans]
MRVRRKLTLGLLAGALVLSSQAPAVSSPATAGPLYKIPWLPVKLRVDDLMARMTLDDKLGQMMQPERLGITDVADLATYRIGSLLSGGSSQPTPNTPESWADMYDNFQRAALKSPLQIPLIYAVDAVHGHNGVHGATVFPHNIGLGATRDPRLAREIGEVTAKEVAGTGIDWNFAPCLCVARNDRWGRTYESFGETPRIAQSMTTIVDGMQGRRLNGPHSVLATAKHYVGDGGTTGGKDQGDTEISEAELRAIHLPPFRDAVLKRELRFDGIVISDYNGVDKIDNQPGSTPREVAASVNAGMDMIMVPFEWKKFIDTLRTEVRAGHVPMSRIDDANRRILTKKFELGLFEKPLTDRRYTKTVGSPEHRALARAAVRESQVLLKNDGNVLPLGKAGNKIFVAGKNADDIGNQAGGWTVGWQGKSGPVTPGTTILQGIRQTAKPSTTVTYAKDGTGIDSSYQVAVAVVGELPYAEGKGDRPAEMGLDAEDLATLATLKASGVPTVVVLVSGRPLDIAAQLPDWKGLVAAWLPGTEGNGVSDVLFGDYNPTGKLPVTWMRSASQQPINAGDGKDALFPYGFGLRYRR